MRQQSVTLREVAHRAGVHPGTASRALNPATRELVKPATAERVLAAADELGYEPDLVARSFRTKRTHSVAIVIPDINNPLFPPMVRGAEDRLAQAGYVALLANTENDSRRQQRIFDQMRGRRVDGFVLATARRRDPQLAALAREGMIISLVNRTTDSRAHSSVTVNDAEGIRLAVEHLRSLGHKRIAFLGGPHDLSTGLARYRGFLDAMGVDPSDGKAIERLPIVTATMFTIEQGLRCTRHLLKKRSRPTAIVAANDMLALGSYSALDELGIRCPEDVSIVGFNDMPFIDRMRPPLTTVRIPAYEMGTSAAELLLERLECPEAGVKALTVDPELVLRGSTDRPGGIRGSATPRT